MPYWNRNLLYNQKKTSIVCMQFARTKILEFIYFCWIWFCHAPNKKSESIYIAYSISIWYSSLTDVETVSSFSSFQALLFLKRKNKVFFYLINTLQCLNDWFYIGYRKQIFHIQFTFCSTIYERFIFCSPFPQVCWAQSTTRIYTTFSSYFR